MNWIRCLDDSLPPANTRVLVSDGETTTIARYVNSDLHRHWFFDLVSIKDTDVVWWQELPTLPPKINTISSSLSGNS